eukprot:g15359.t1
MASAGASGLMEWSAAEAVPVEQGADYLDVLDAVSVTVGDRKVIDLARVGVYPGPRSAVHDKSAMALISTVFPLMVATGRANVPDLIPLALGNGSNAAEAVMNAKRAIIAAVLEFLFPAPDHGGVRIVPAKCLFLTSALLAVSTSAAGGGGAGAGADSPAVSKLAPAPASTPTPTPAPAPAPEAAARASAADLPKQTAEPRATAKRALDDAAGTLGDLLEAEQPAKKAAVQGSGTAAAAPRSRTHMSLGTQVSSVFSFV